MENSIILLIRDLKCIRHGYYTWALEANISLRNEFFQLLRNIDGVYSKIFGKLLCSGYSPWMTALGRLI